MAYVRITTVGCVFWDDGEGLSPAEQISISVIEDDAAPVETGILDADGIMIGRLPDRIPIGFHSPLDRKD